MIKFISLIFVLFFIEANCQNKIDSIIEVSPKKYSLKTETTNGITLISYNKIDVKIYCRMNKNKIDTIYNVLDNADTLYRFKNSEIIGFEEVAKKSGIVDWEIFTRIREIEKSPEKREKAYRNMKRSYKHLEPHRFGVFSEGFAIIKQNKKFGFINDKGEIVIECIFENALNFTEGKALVKYNGVWHKLSKEGKLLPE